MDAVSLHWAVLARLQQFTTLCLLVAALGWGAFHLSRGQPWWALAGVLLILLGYALVLALEFLVMAWANRRDELPPPSWQDVVGAWWGEVCSAPRVFCWQQPFRSQAMPDQLIGADGQRGLVLVHGFVCNRGLWHRWLPRLRQLGIPYVAVNLEPVFGDIDDYAPQIEAAVVALQASTGLAPVIVAHSMGGLAVRVWLRTRADSVDANPAVHHVVTLGTPHRGTALARFAFTSNTRQMAWRSGWLDQLGAVEAPALRARFTCVYSNCDNIVFPTSAATLPHSAARALQACAHVQMVFRPEAFDEVMRHLG